MGDSGIVSSYGSGFLFDYGPILLSNIPLFKYGTSPYRIPNLVDDPKVSHEIYHGGWIKASRILVENTNVNF